MGTLNDRTYEYLGNLGFSGSINDRMVAYWASEGFSGAFNDKCKAFLKTNGFKSLNKWMEGLDGSVNPPDSAIEIPDLILIGGRSTEQVAPEGISFALDLAELNTPFSMSAPSGVYDARMHDLTFVWSFGDSYEFVAPVNLPEGFKDAGGAIGPRAAHVYRQPGTYDVRVDVYGIVSGTLVHAYSETSVTVGDPDSLFTGTRTIFVSPSSDFSLAPSGAETTNNINNATDWANDSGRNPIRIMLNRGETYSFSGRRFGFNTGEASTVHIVAGPGEGAAPILTASGTISCGANNDSQYVDKTLVVQGLVLNGPYDPVTPGDPDTTDAFSFWGPYTPCQVLVDRCEARGFGHGVYMGDSGDRHIYFNDSVIEGYGQWGIMGGNTSGLNVLGTRIMGHVDAPVDNGTSKGGTMRVNASSNNVLLASCDFFCRQGWSGLPGSRIAVQPCVRYESNEISGSLLSVSRSSFEGGFTIMSISNGEGTARPQNIVIDSNYLLGGYQTGAFVGMDCGGASIRNNVFVVPDTVTRFGPGLGSVVGMSSGGHAGNIASPVRVYCNTVVNLTDETLSEYSVSGFTDVTVENNVIHQPDASPSQVADAPLVTSPAMWTPREKGYKSTTVTLMTDTATPAGAPASYAPDTGSAAIGDADSGLVPTLNYPGDARDGTPNRGAW